MRFSRQRVVSLLSVSFFILSAQFCYSFGKSLSPPLLIAHAGGGIEGQTYTNSLEALSVNYKKGYRFFEIDFSWTSDGELVAIHDWEETLRWQFNIPGNLTIPTKSQFLHLNTKNGLTQLSMAGVLEWAATKGDAFIITDLKYDNIRALNKIYIEFNEYVHFIIPQVYDYKEYYEVAKIGYRNIILTVYKMRIKPHELLEFTKKNSPFAITMPLILAQKGLAFILKDSQTVVYAHTINDLRTYCALKSIGVFGIYTDFIAPHQISPSVCSP